MKREKTVKLKLEVPRIRNYRRIVLTRSKGLAVGKYCKIHISNLNKTQTHKTKKTNLMHMAQAQVYVRGGKMYQKHYHSAESCLSHTRTLTDQVQHAAFKVQQAGREVEEMMKEKKKGVE